MKKIGYFFYSFLPLLLIVAMTYLFLCFAGGLGTFSILFRAFLSGTKMSYQELMQSMMRLFTNQDFTAWVSVLFSTAGIVVFGYWYRKKFPSTSNASLNPLASFNRKIIRGLIFVLPPLQISAGYISHFVGILFPSWMRHYEEVLEAAGLTSKLSGALLLYAILLGPIEEELVFRGVTLSAARRALPFWAANLLQAILFGIFHRNMVQGIYTFFVALFFGYIYYLTDRIYVTIFLHMLFNSLGSLFAGGSSMSPGLIFFGCLLLLFFGLYQIKKGGQELNAKPDLPFS